MQDQSIRFSKKRSCCFCWGSVLAVYRKLSLNNRGNDIKDLQNGLRSIGLVVDAFEYFGIPFKSTHTTSNDTNDNHHSTAATARGGC